MPVLTPGGIIIGLLLGSLVVWMKPAVTYLFAFVTFTGAMEMNLSDFRKVLTHIKPLLFVFVCSHIATPLLVYLLTSVLFPSNPDIATGFILLTAIPIAVSSYVWTSIFYGNGPMTLTLVLIDTFLAPYLTPLTVRLLTSSKITIDTTGMMISLIIMVVIPSVLGMLLNSIKPDYTKKAAPCCKPFAKLALFAVVILNGASISTTVQFKWSFLPIVFINMFISLGGFLMAYGFSRLAHASVKDSVSMTITGGMRNISAALVLAMNFFPPESSIPVVCGILFQQMLIACTCRFLFGKYQEQQMLEEK